MILGIDIGGTNTQGVLIEKGRPRSFFSVEGNEPGHALRCFDSLRRNAGDGPFKLALTGGGSRKIERSHFQMPFRLVDEIKAIGTGGAYLSGKNDIFVVSIGTGTAFVSVKAGKVKHVGGTGVGGGTIHGLSRLMLKMPLDKIEEMAKRAGGNLDLTVKDIIGGNLGNIPASATASNFGKARESSKRPEIASSLFNMIGESIGVMSYFAARSTGQESGILICGRVAMNGVVKNRVLETIKMMGGDAIMPKNAQYCAAIGAAVSLS